MGTSPGTQTIELPDRQHPRHDAMNLQANPLGRPDAPGCKMLALERRAPAVFGHLKLDLE